MYVVELQSQFIHSFKLMLDLSIFILHIWHIVFVSDSDDSDR